MESTKRRRRTYDEIRKDSEKRAKMKKQTEEDEEENCNRAYTCCSCKLKSARKNMIACALCKLFYHSCCFSKDGQFSYETSLKRIAKCPNCVSKNYRNICLLIYHSIDTNSIDDICANFDAHIDISDSLPTFDTEYEPYKILTSQRGFVNKESNCWASASMQLLFSSPLSKILESQKETDVLESKDEGNNAAYILNDIFKKMQMNKRNSISNRSLHSIANICEMAMDLTLHQDAAELLVKILTKLRDNIVLDEAVSRAFGIQVIPLRRCTNNKCKQYKGSLAHPEMVVDLKLSNASRTNMSTLMYMHFTGEFCEQSCSCSLKDTEHDELYAIRRAPSFLFLRISREFMNPNTKSTVVSRTRV